MKILETLIKGVEKRKIVSVHIGFFTTAVVSKGRRGDLKCGLASTLRADKCRSGIRGAGKFEGRKVSEIGRFLISGQGPEISIGMAALNSALPEYPYQEINAEKIILEKAFRKKVAIIGHFPFTDKIRNIAEKLWVFELEPKDNKDLPFDRALNILPRVDVVAITAMSLLNGTFSKILSYCHRDSFKILLGPSTPLTPLLFDFGINAICGVKVFDHKALIKALSQGSNFRSLPGKKMVALINKTKKLGENLGKGR
ncbi:MAG: DUF364 domain-containing protein [Elusimicrobiota bacterium]